jgi:ArsR family transcriptional regulator, lead/cadmium/zinc/bismuth-responsive transcriptional repressor
MSEPTDVRSWADLFAVLGDPSRLALLLAIRGAGSISVSDLAAATGLKASTVSHALRLLRVSELVVARRSGHTVRYSLGDSRANLLLDHVEPLPIS